MLKGRPVKIKGNRPKGKNTIKKQKQKQNQNQKMYKRKGSCHAEI